MELKDMFSFLKSKSNYKCRNVLFILTLDPLIRVGKSNYLYKMWEYFYKTREENDISKILFLDYIQGFPSNKGSSSLKSF